MASIVWDEVGSHFYESGIDRGVLYSTEGNGVAWNGLISVDETVDGNSFTPLYFDGVKYADVLALGDFSGTLKAYTYPDEFLELEGVLEIGNGLFATNQSPQRFGLSYRAKIDSDVGEEGYKIHVLYNLLAVPASTSHQTLTDQSAAIEFEWSLTSIPGNVPGFRPTAHLIFDSRLMAPLLLSDIENTLYGDELNNAKLPPISTLTSFIGAWVIIRITDNFDGTWTATGPDDLITMLDATTFQIIQANAVYLDADTYMISDLTY